MEKPVKVVERDGVLDIEAKCPVCRRIIYLSPAYHRVFEVPMHMDKYGICNGTGLRAGLLNSQAKQRGDKWLSI